MSILTLAPHRCPVHGAVLSGGPVAFHCDVGTGHGHEVHAADIDLEVAPLTAMTTRERYMAGFPARDKDEEARYGELGRCGTPTLHEPHPERYSYEAAVDGDYPAVIHEPGECAACDASAAFYARLDAEDDARWARAELARAVVTS